METAEQRDLLERLGCSFFQGYLYARALPFDEMTERVRTVGAGERAEGAPVSASR